MDSCYKKLWYNTEAKEWVEALPIGNGFIGAMAYGGTTGLFSLSENTCWSGAVEEKPFEKNVNYYMKKTREALANDNHALAHELLEKCQGIHTNYGTQLPMGEMRITLHDTYESQSRMLDIEDGVLEDYFIKNGQNVIRRVFASHEERSIRFSVVGDLPDITIGLEGNMNPSTRRLQEGAVTVKGIALENLHSDGRHGVSYKMHLDYDTDGKVRWNRYGAYIENATYITGALVAQTDYRRADIEVLIQHRLEAVKKYSFDEAYRIHTLSHSELMGRCELNLPTNQNSNLPTNERRAAFENDNSDQAFISLFFQYGRYLILDSSREDSELPAALQGIWNDNRAAKMGWTDDMHLDINTQMNYFGVEPTGIGECSHALFKFLKEIVVPSGEETAKSLYGVDGWCAHIFTNAHGFTTPGWSTEWGFFVCGGAWTALEIWRHYEYTLDREFLSEYYSVLRGAAQCLSQLLETDSQTGYLLLNPSMSPENVFVRDKKSYAMDRGTVVDSTICHCLFSAVVKASEILDSADEFVEILSKQLVKLPPYQIGSEGQLLEWFLEEEELWPDHRHTSHLLTLYPFETIHPIENKKLADACSVSISKRLENDNGDIVLFNWAANLLIAYYAKLREAKKASDLVERTIQLLSRDNLLITHTGDTSSPIGGIYELDGNTGLTASICEMLLQRVGDTLYVLPCLPENWKCGTIKGLRAPGNIIFDMEWSETKVIISTENIVSTLVYKENSLNNAQGTLAFNR